MVAAAGLPLGAARGRVRRVRLDEARFWRQRLSPTGSPHCTPPSLRPWAATATTPARGPFACSPWRVRARAPCDHRRCRHRVHLQQRWQQRQQQRRWKRRRRGPNGRRGTAFDLGNGDTVHYLNTEPATWSRAAATGSSRFSPRIVYDEWLHYGWRAAPSRGQGVSGAVLQNGIWRRHNTPTTRHNIDELSAKCYASYDNIPSDSIS